MASLNLAAIVLRLTRNPRGWRVDDLCSELGIAPRTYRKYRRVLQKQFVPFLRHGASMVQEVVEQDGRYLRLVEPRPIPSPQPAPHQVELLFASDLWLQRYVQAQTWFPGQVFEVVAGGQLRMRFGVRSLAGVGAWLRQFGADVEILRPAELRQRVGSS